MCVCVWYGVMCLCVEYTYMCVQVCMPKWRQEEDFGCSVLSDSSLLFSLDRILYWARARQAASKAPSFLSPALSHTVFWVQANISTHWFLCRDWDLNSGPQSHETYNFWISIGYQKSDSLGTFDLPRYCEIQLNIVFRLGSIPNILYYIYEDIPKSGNKRI